MYFEEIPNIHKEINKRFFMVVEILRQSRQIRGIGQLAREWNTSRFTLSWAKNHPGEKRLKVEHLYYLAKDYNVSLDYLFFGIGPMFKK